METRHVRKRLFGRGEAEVESTQLLEPLLDIEVRRLPLILRTRRTSDISVGMQVIIIKEREFWIRG